MIATLSTIVFIVSEKRDVLGDRIIQKGQAISKISDEHYQLYNYTLFVPLHQETVSNSYSTEVMDTDNENIQLVEPENLYLFHGKFSANADCSLEVAVTSNHQLPISHEDTPISRPFIHLLGRTQSIPIKTKSGYQVVLQVKPYVSKQQCGPMNIVLVHSLEGRFKNALEKTTNLALVHVMGILVEHEKTFYCDILEYQFIGIRPEEGSGINVPWKTQSLTQNNNQQQPSSSSTMNNFEKRIQAIHKDIQEMPPESSGTKRGRTHSSSKSQGKRTKVSEIAVDLLTGKKTKQNTGSTDPTTHNEAVEDNADNTSDHSINKSESDEKESPPSKKHNTRQRRYSEK